MDELISEPEEIEERSIEDLIMIGESPTLEFKSSLQWDVVEGEKNKILRFELNLLIIQ